MDVEDMYELPEERCPQVEFMQADYANGQLYWETQGGRTILVQNMETTHIENTIAMIRRSRIKTYGDGQWIFIFEHELMKRKLNIK